jgi:hypothetical protein
VEANFLVECFNRFCKVVKSLKTEIHDAMWGGRRAAACCENVKMSGAETHLAFIKAIYGGIGEKSRVENEGKLVWRRRDAVAWSGCVSA